MNAVPGWRSRGASEDAGRIAGGLLFSCDETISLTWLSLKKRTQILQIPALHRMTAAAVRLKYVLNPDNGARAHVQRIYTCTWERELVETASWTRFKDSTFRCMNGFHCRV